MIKLFRKSLLFLSLGLLGVLMVSTFFLNEPHLKYAPLGMWVLTTIFAIGYTARFNTKTNKIKAKQCDVCNLFIPLETDTGSALKPHCCYQKPKEPGAHMMRP